MPWQLPYNASLNSSLEDIFLHAVGPLFNPWHLQLFLNLTLLKIVTAIPGNETYCLKLYECSSKLHLTYA